ncbi:MAG: universal stress protein, partial [Pacificimonas sp.]
GVASREMPERALATEAILSDLLIMSQFEDKSGDEQAHSSFIGRVLGECATAVMQVPAGGYDIGAGTSAIVAWNGSEQAARAVRATLPVLAMAETVTLFTSGALDRNKVGASEAAAYLASHGISADIHDVPKGGEPGERLLQEARERDAGLIVMGAYGRSRLAERLLGGTTQYVVGAADRPIIFHG